MFEIIDIYCKKGNCPICKKSMVKNQFNRIISCSNGCYSYKDGITFKRFTIFGNTFTHINQELKPVGKKVPRHFKKSVVVKIKYWKKNNRYLAEILGRS